MGLQYPMYIVGNTHVYPMYIREIHVWPMLSHAAASRPPGLAAERGNVAPRPAADAAGCKEIAAPRLPSRLR